MKGYQARGRERGQAVQRDQHQHHDQQDDGEWSGGVRLRDHNFTKLPLCVVKVNGEPRKDHHKGKWEQVVQKATRSLQEMLRAASQRRRNVIIDQVGRHVSVLVWVCCALSSAVHHHQHHSNYQKNICPSLEENYSHRKCRNIRPVQSNNDSELRHTQCTVKYRY